MEEFMKGMPKKTYMGVYNEDEPLPEEQTKDIQFVDEQDLRRTYAEYQVKDNVNHRVLPVGG